MFKTSSNHRLGKEAEAISSEYLKEKNFSIIDQNWHSGKYGEIDIIAVDKNTKELVFVEVKSRTTSIDDAKEMVTKTKQKKLYKLAETYVYLKDKSNCRCRFDVIALLINRDKIKLEHVKNAF